MKIKKIALYMASVVVWICVWDLAANHINNDIFLPTPKKVISVTFSELLPSEIFRQSVINSVLHIFIGFLAGSFIGILLAILASVSKILEALLWLPIKVIKTIPVASFVILSLLWYDAEQLASVISAMVVLPIFYINTKTGIDKTNEKLLDMARVYKVSFFKRILYIYAPSILSYVLSAASLAVGMAWKSGIAAEIIGLSKNSIGNELYKAKIHLLIPELFAWTIVVVILCILCEAIIKFLVGLAEGKNEKN